MLRLLSFFALGFFVHGFFVHDIANAQSPLAPFLQSPRRSIQLADDESPFRDDPIEQPTTDAPAEVDGNAIAEEGETPVRPEPLTPPAPTLPRPAPATAPPAFEPPADLSPLAPGALAGGAGLASSFGATRDSYSAAPNMIGDLFNSGTSSLNFQAKFSVLPQFINAGQLGGLVVPTGASLASGVNAPISGVTVTSLSNIGDLVRRGDSSFISVADLEPIKSINVQTGSTTVAVPQPFGVNATSAAAPMANSQIFEAANRAVARELSTGLSGDVNVEDMITLEYVEAESIILLSQGEASPTYVYNASVSLPVPSPGEVVGRYTIADNNSPLPQNRLFLDYNFFHNARITAAGIPVNRWAPGFESTFADGLGSIEFRAPMAVTLTSAVNTSGDDLAAFEFGDISFTLKGLLHRDERFIASAGLGITLPTADDFTLSLEDNTEVVRLENESVHLLPFVAGSINVGRNGFVQSFTQFDFDANGNSVFLDEQGFRMQGAGQLQGFGKLKSQSTIRFSNSAGYFLFRNRQQRVSDLAAVLEAHYTGTLNKSDAVGSANFAVGDPTRTLSVLNLTSGMHAYMGKSVVTAAYGVPVTEDRVFDGELRLFINRYF